MALFDEINKMMIDVTLSPGSSTPEKTQIQSLIKMFHKGTAIQEVCTIFRHTNQQSSALFKGTVQTGYSQTYTRRETVSTGSYDFFLLFWSHLELYLKGELACSKSMSRQSISIFGCNCPQYGGNHEKLSSFI